MVNKRVKAFSKTDSQKESGNPKQNPQKSNQINRPYSFVINNGPDIRKTQKKKKKEMTLGRLNQLLKSLNLSYNKKKKTRKCEGWCEKKKDQINGPLRILGNTGRNPTMQCSENTCTAMPPTRRYTSCVKHQHRHA